MMKFKSTIVFAFLVLAVVIFAILEYKKSAVEEESQSTKNNIVLNYTPSDVAQISFKSNEQVYVLKRENTGWLVIEPVADVADSQAVETVISEIFSQNVEGLEENGEKLDPAKYGLSTPLAEYNFTFTDSKIQKIALGSVRTYDNGYYIQKNGEASILVGGPSWDALLAKKAEEFRSKKINLADGELVWLRIISKIKGQESDLQFERAEGQWISAKHKNIKINQSAVIDYFNSLHHLRADGIHSDTSGPGELKKNKLSNADLVIELKTSAGDEKSQLAKISFKFFSETEVLMTSTVNQPIYKISKSKISEFAKLMSDFRDKKFPFAYSHTKSAFLEIKKNSGKDILSLEKSGESWVNSANPHVKLNQSDIDKLIGGLLQLEAREFVGTAKASPPTQNSVVIKDVDGKILFSMFYEPDKKDEFYRVVTNLSDEAFLIAKASAEELLNKKFIELPATETKEEKAK